MEIYIEKGDDQRSMQSAILAYNSSKRGNKDSKKHTKEAFKYIKNESKSLASLFTVRDDIVEDLLGLRKKATKRNKAADAEWILRTAVRTHPTHADVEESAGAGSPRIHGGGKGHFSYQSEVEPISKTFKFGFRLCR